MKRETVRLLCLVVTNFTVNKVPSSSGKQHRIKNEEKDLARGWDETAQQPSPRRIYKRIALTTAALPFRLAKIKI